jgi:hypothetical protein
VDALSAFEIGPFVMVMVEAALLLGWKLASPE